MYKVLLVDDEQLARDSIANLVDWEAHDLHFLGAAKNGFEAFELIVRHAPDIVITDIKMPVMDGFQLINKVRAVYPNTVFVVLSGYGEYEYTSQAMELGIRHYLLKPTNENKIVDIINAVKEELERREEDERFVQLLEDKLDKTLPFVKEQLLRDIAITGVYSKNDLEYFMELFHIAGQKFKVVLVMFDKPCDYIEKFALKNIAEEIITAERIFLSTIIENCVLMLVKAMDLQEIAECLIHTRQMYEKYYKINLFMAVSQEGAVTNIRSMYKEAQECLKFRYYMEDGGIITIDDIDGDRRKRHLDIPLIFEEIVSAVQSGRTAELNDLLEDMFVQFESEKLKINEIKAYVLELFLKMIINSREEILSKQMMNVSKFQDLQSSHSMFELLSTIAVGLAQENYEKTIHKQSALIQSVKDIVQKNISNPDLSLKWIANQLLYMNEDYLGKVISRETGERFSQYVLSRRMELAQHLFTSRSELKISEIAVMTGFAEDAQYFSKVFKKYTGFTPSEYKKNMEDSRN